MDGGGGFFALRALLLLGSSRSPGSSSEESEEAFLFTAADSDMMPIDNFSLQARRLGRHQPQTAVPFFAACLAISKRRRPLALSKFAEISVVLSGKRCSYSSNPIAGCGVRGVLLFCWVYHSQLAKTPGKKKKPPR
jgi:hypothetical protein